MYFAHPIDFFCLTNFEETKYQFIQVWFLFSMITLVLILIRAIMEPSINNKMVSKI